MDKNKTTHCHRRKSSEQFIDKELILSKLNILPGQTILDAGCGNGYMSKEFAILAGKNGKVYALDPDELSIESLKNEIESNITEAFAGDITQRTKLKNSSLDLIYISTVIHGFSKNQINGFIKEINRILKPNGRLAILEINKEQTPFGPPMEIRFSPDELELIIKLKPAQTINIREHFYLKLFNNTKNSFL